MKITFVSSDSAYSHTVSQALSRAGITISYSNSLSDLEEPDLVIGVVDSQNAADSVAYAKQGDLIALAEPGSGFANEDKANFCAWLTLPVRLGNLIETVKAYKSRQEQREKLKPVKMGHYILKPANNEIEIKDRKALITLTGKEQDILLYLYAHKDEPVGRDELLDNVWGYAEGIETHTLETHIYRLRQKIELDPAAPQFLVTDDKGYYLNF